VLHDDCDVFEVDPPVVRVVLEVEPPVVWIVIELVPPAPPTTTVTDPLSLGEFQGVCWVSLGAV
jgi:hypothetical protein